MASRNTPVDRVADKAASFGDQLADRVGGAEDSLSDAARTVIKKVDDARATAADRLETTASEVEERVSAAADRLSSTADYVRSHDAKTMIKDVEEVVKNNPGPALLLAAAFGFVLGRAMTRN